MLPKDAPRNRTWRDAPEDETCCGRVEAGKIGQTLSIRHLLLSLRSILTLYPKSAFLSKLHPYLRQLSAPSLVSHPPYAPFPAASFYPLAPPTHIADARRMIFPCRTSSFSRRKYTGWPQRSHGRHAGIPSGGKLKPDLTQRKTW